MVAACFDIIRREINDLTPEELDDLLREMRRRQRGYMQQGMPAQDAGQRAAQSVVDDLKMAAAIERRNAAINLRIRREALDFVNSQFADNPAEGLTALLAGSNKAGRGTRMSADAVQQALKRQYIGGLIGDLERAGHFEAFAEGALDLPVARALWAIKSPEEFAKLPQQAREIAQIIRRWQEKARVDANRAGAWIGEIEGYIVRQSHNADRIQRAGFQRWRDAILPRLDLERMFPDGIPSGVDLERYLDEAFTGIVTGIHETIPGAATKMAAFQGPGNLAKKISQERKLHFKSADDWYEYNREFGAGNLREATLLGLSRSADATGVMRVLGTNPEANLQAIYDALRGQLREARDTAKLEQLRRWGNPTAGWGKALLDEVLRRTSSPAGRTLATAGAVIRGWNSMTALGSAVLSSVTDIPTRAMELRYQGQNFLGAVAEGLLLPITRLVESAKTKAERKALLAELGYFSEGVSGLLGARFSAQDGLPGAMAQAQRLFFKANFLAGWTDIMRDASMLATSGHLAALSDLDFRALPEASRRLVEQYGIGPDEWQVLRAATRTLGDKTVMSPQAVREMPTARFARLASERINALKAGLAERLQRRFAQDEREQQWVAARAAKLQQQLADATQRLNERIERADAKHQGALRDLQAKLVSLYDRLDMASDYWTNIAESQVSLSALRRAGIAEGRQQAEITRLNSRARSIVRDLQSMKEGLDTAFREKWFARQEELDRLLREDRRSPEELSAKVARFEELFADANAALTNRLASADARVAERIRAVQAKIDNATNRMRETAAIWQQASQARPTFSGMRRAGVNEGRAREAAKAIAAEARALGRDLERLKKELSEDFVTRWSERQADLEAFAERVDQRIAERAQRTAEELGDLEPRIERILEDTREDLAVKLQTLLSDRVDYAVISPDARARAVTTWGSQRGTAAGEISRAVMQFKSFGVGFTQRALGREAFGYGARRLRDIRSRELLGIAQLMATTTAFGYLAMAAKDMVKGKKPRSPDDWRTWVAAMQQGGGFGIYGDFLFAEANRFGRSPVETFTGPTIGKAGEVWDIIQSAKRLDDPSAKAFRFAVNNTPFVNLFYTRLALDYAFFWQIQEYLNPGYLRRVERRARQDDEQEYWLPPTEALR